MKYMRIMIFSLILFGLTANVAPAYFEHQDIPGDSNAIAFDQWLLLQEANEGFIWPDAVYSQQFIYAQQDKTIQDAFMAHNLSFTLRAFPRENNNFILPLLNRGLLNYTTGNHDKAYRYLLNAQGVMDSLRQKSTVLAGERAKIFKGEHYEQAMANFYLGLMLYEKGDFDNARAMFSRTLECDRETVPTMKRLEGLAKTYTRKKKGGTEREFIDLYRALGNDNRLAYYMLARTYMKLGEERNLQISLTNTANWHAVPDFIKLETSGKFTPMANIYDIPPPLNNEYMTQERLKKDNLVILIQMGFAPEKKIGGFQGQKDLLAPNQYPERKAVVYVDGKKLGEPYPIFNLMHQATCTVRSLKDTAQTGKAVGKFAATLLAAMVSDDLARAVQSQWSVAADTRRWGSLPNEVHLLSARVEPGLHQLTILFYDQDGNPLPHYEQTHYFVPTREDKETFLVLRSIRDKCNTVGDFYGSKVASYNKKKNEIVFNARDLADLQVGNLLDVISADFGSAKLNEEFIKEGYVPSPGNTLKSFLKQRFNLKYKGLTITKVAVARVDKIMRAKATCSLIEGTLDPKRVYFVTDYKLPSAIIREHSNHDILGR